MPQIDLRPGQVDFKAKAGDDVAFTITLPMNTTGGTHELLIAEGRPGSPMRTLTDGDGLTVTNGASTTVAVSIPKEFTVDYGGRTLVYDYKLTLGGQTRTKLCGNLELAVSIVG